MAIIVVKVEVQFDGTSWTDISDRTTKAKIRYGRRNILDEFSTGTATVQIDNRDNYLTPGHSDSTMGNTQLINRQLKISARVTGGSDSYNTYLWRGFISDVDYRAGQSTSTVTIRTVDGFDRLAKTSIFNQAFAEQYTGVRIAAILDLAAVDYPNGTSPIDRQLDLGIIQATATSSNVTANALDYCKQLARTENGRFLVNHAGQPSATNKGGILSFYEINNPTETGISISDAASLPSGAVEARQLHLEWGSEQLFNSFEFTASDGAVQTNSDSASIAKYGPRVVKRTLLSAAADADEAGDFFIFSHKEPALRASSVVVDIDSATTADAEKLLHVHVMSALDLSYLPPGSSTTLAGDYIVEGVDLDITVRDMATNSARIKGTYSTSAATAGGYWLLGDAVLGALPTTLAPSWLVTGGFRLGDPERDELPVTL
jgi:hypothetical protein